MLANPSKTLLALLGMAPVAGSAAELEFYRDVFPFLKANCISCHNKTTTKAGLNMETPELMKKGGDSGPALVPGKGAESLVVLASEHKEDMEMPPQKNKSGAVKLTAREIEIFTKWIDEGAKSSVQEVRQVVWQALPSSVDPIYSVAVTADGRYAACGRSNKVFVYDLATRQIMSEVTDAALKPGGAHRAMVQSLAFSPDGTRLATGSFREVKIWRLNQGKPVPVVANAPAAAVSADVLKRLTAAGKTAIVSHGVSADGKTIVTGGADGSVRVWDAATSKPIADLRGSVSVTRSMAKLEWTVAAQGLEQAFHKTEIARIEAQNKALDELLKKANEAIVAMKKVLPEKQKLVAPATAAKAAAQKVVTDVTAKIAAAPKTAANPALDTELKTAQDKLLTAETAEISALAAVSAAESNIKDAEADLQRITTTKDANAKLVAAATAALASSKKTQDQATADLAAAKAALAKSKGKPVAVAFSPDAQVVVASFDDRAVRAWAVATGTPIEETPSSATAATTKAAAEAKAAAPAAAEAPALTMAGKPQWVLERVLGGEAAQEVFVDRVNAVRFSPDGKTLATGGGDPSRSGDIHLFEVATGKLVKSWKERHDDAVLSLDFSLDGRLLASGAADKLAHVTDITTGKPVHVFEGHTHHVMGVAFRADSRVLATAGADGTVLVWDMLAGERKKKIEGWTKEVTSLQFIGATNHLVTSAGDNLVRVVSDDGRQIRAIDKLPDFMQSAASTASGGTIIGGGEDSLLRVWDGVTGKEVAVFADK